MSLLLEPIFFLASVMELESRHSFKKSGFIVLQKCFDIIEFNKFVIRNKI